MPYSYLEDRVTADAAFEAWGETVEELFISASDATMNLMVADLDTIADRERRVIEAEESALDMLLFDLLQDLIFYKDAERLFLRLDTAQICEKDNVFRLRAEAYGEELNPDKHDLLVDVKAVTFHHFRVEKTGKGWTAEVIVDI